MKTKSSPALIFSLAFTYYTSVAQKTITYSEAKAEWSPNGQESQNRVILPAWMGIDENAKIRLPPYRAGLLHLCADIYGDGKYPTDMSSASKNFVVLL